MVFLDPKSDIAFKKLFGDQARQELLISFLNSILNRKDGERIVSVVMTNPYNQPDADWLKLSIVDVSCIDEKGKNYIVEVQVEFQDDYPERSQYYSALAIARQLKTGGKYKEVMPVIFVGILDFSLFKSPDYISQHLISNTKTGEHALQLLEFYFIELEKFNKTIDQLETIADKWIYFLKNARKLDRVPEQLQNPSELNQAFCVLEEGKLSAAELAAYDRFIDARRVYESIRDTQIRIGIEKGIEQGVQQGIEQGIQQGIQQGRKQILYEMAQKLLFKFDVAEVVAMTGLSVEEVTKLKK